MKYVVIIGDGMADYPVPQLNNMTPLQYAVKPNMDYLVKHGETGLVKTIPDGIPPGSDTANLSVMGYDPVKYYTGRSSLEAAGMGINLADTDLTFRCNLVTLSDEPGYADRTMIDYSSDEISTAEAAMLIEEINKHIPSAQISFYPGISYRHCMVWKNAASVNTPMEFSLTPPHDILGKKVGCCLPSGENSRILLDMMLKSHELLKCHHVNKARVSAGLRPANSIWLWGMGKKPAIPGFTAKYGLKSSVISAVDLVKGIGICAGLKPVKVDGVTGNIHTNFRGKAEAALKELESGQDFVFVHVEAPDECGHRFETENKVKAIEYIDKQIVGVILEGLEKHWKQRMLRGFEDYRIMILPDHPTPLLLRTHTSDPVPFIIYRKSIGKDSGIDGYDEFKAKESGLFIDKGYTLMDYFLKA